MYNLSRLYTRLFIIAKICQSCITVMNNLTEGQDRTRQLGLLLNLIEVVSESFTKCTKYDI